MVSKRGLTPKQRRFVQEYLVDLCATQAAIRAGYSAKTATELGYQLLQHPSVQTEIVAAQATRAERTKVDQDWVIEQLIKVYQTSMEAPSLNLGAANRALELLGKHQGMFVDRKLIGMKRIDEMTEEELVEFLGDDGSKDGDSFASAEPLGNA
jgi:phage terminase small subunit